MVKTYGIIGGEFEEATLQEILDYFKDRSSVQFDTETQGFSPHVGWMLCFQLGDFENQFVIHASKLSEFKKLLEDKELIGHNIKFDLGFLYKNGVWPRKVYDTFLAEGVIHCGIKTIKKSLAATAQRRLDVNLDKTERANIAKYGLTTNVIWYSADDVKYLDKIRESQQVDLERLDLTRALEIENEFVRCLAYIELCGFKLDEAKWQEKMKADLEDVAKVEAELNKFIIDNKLTKFIDRQLDLFSTEIQTKINWSSSKQVIDLFKQLKIPVTHVIKGEKKDSVEAKHMSRYKKDYPIVKLYLDFKEKEKIVTTYGDTFLRQINASTGRLHTNFKQIMDTSRLSSGGKDKNTGEEYINFQNIPTNPEKKDQVVGRVYARDCFISEKGNTLVISDFSGQEAVVLANKSLDKNLLKFYDEGLGDFHSFVASKMYPHLEGLTAKEIKEKYYDERYKAKTAGFAITFGGVGKTIADQLDIPLEDGERTYNAYFEAFPDLKIYFAKVKKQGLDNGYIVFNDITNRKSFFYGYEEYQQLNKEINRNFWDRWKVVKKAYLEKNERYAEYNQMKEKISKYFKIRGEIERKSLNFPIQGTAAEITKIAGIYFFNWILEQNLQNTVLIPNVVHDEYVAECPVGIKDMVGEKLKECMEDAAFIYCKRVKIKATPVFSTKWDK